jgi:hypothetical protein
VPSSSLSGGDATFARRQAREILAERRFHLAPIPRPLHSLLHAIGRALESPLNAVNELVSELATGIPGGAAVVWGVLAALILLGSVLLAVRGARRKLAEPHVGGARSGMEATLSAADLQRAAALAERDGRHEEAVRLRFRAGLLLLGENELVAFVPSMSNAEVSRALRSQRFDELARRFDEIVYGGRVAAEEDAETSREEWSRLLGSAGRR